MYLFGEILHLYCTCNTKTNVSILWPWLMAVRSGMGFWAWKFNWELMWKQDVPQIPTHCACHSEQIYVPIYRASQASPALIVFLHSPHWITKQCQFQWISWSHKKLVSCCHSIWQFLGGKVAVFCLICQGHDLLSTCIQLRNNLWLKMPDFHANFSESIMFHVHAFCILPFSFSFFMSKYDFVYWRECLIITVIWILNCVHWPWCGQFRLWVLKNAMLH